MTLLVQNKTKNIIILGSTGSIGTQVLDIVYNHPNRFNIMGLSAGSNIELLAEQARQFAPNVLCVKNEADIKPLQALIPDFKGKIVFGEAGLIEIQQATNFDSLIVGLVGAIGLKPTLEALKSGKKVLTANKETFVAGGHLVKPYLKQILPLDSEHSAIHQCLNKKSTTENTDSIKKLILTASGGPFWNKPLDEFPAIQLSDALKHPNWTMGQKITIDSATMMNKGLEVIEAHWLFDVDYGQIDILVHPQSIVHGLIEFNDGAVLAQLGAPDMHTPLQYAMTYPERLNNHHTGSFLDFTALKQLDFAQPDTQKFPCIQLAYEAGRMGCDMSNVLNATNEIAVSRFLKEEISFTDIPKIIETVMKLAQNEHFSPTPNLDEVLHIDQWARQEAINHSLKTHKVG